MLRRDGSGRAGIVGLCDVTDHMRKTGEVRVWGAGGVGRGGGVESLRRGRPGYRLLSYSEIFFVADGIVGHDLFGDPVMPSRDGPGRPEIVWNRETSNKVLLAFARGLTVKQAARSEEPTSELQSLVRISYSV